MKQTFVALGQHVVEETVADKLGGVLGAHVVRHVQLFELTLTLVELVSVFLQSVRNKIHINIR